MSGFKGCELWESVEKTDPDFTKHVGQRGGYTAIDPTYQAREATKKFGPYGSGWGLCDSNIDLSTIEKTSLAIHSAIFFYKAGDVVHRFPIHNAIKVIGKYGPDEDFAKKLETNTISKALSRLGFNADVFLGRFDNQDYFNQVATEASIAKAEDREAEIATKRSDLMGYVRKHMSQIEDAENKNIASVTHKSAIRHLLRQKMIPEVNDVAERGVKAIHEAHSDKIKQLENNDETA